jgi:hypothetical protein
MESFNFLWLNDVMMWKSKNRLKSKISLLLWKAWMMMMMMMMWTLVGLGKVSERM